MVFNGLSRVKGAARTVIPAVLLSFFIVSCGPEDSYYIVGSPQQKQELRLLFDLLENEREIGDNRFVIVSQIARLIFAAGETEKLNLFLTTYVESTPDDPFNAYYLYLVAENFRKQKAFPLASYYYEQILRNYPDLIVQGKSVHHQCLQELIAIVDNPAYRVEYYKDLLSRFSDRIDMGSMYFALGKTYEQLGEWNLSFQAYTRFLHYPATVIPGYPNAYKDISAMQAFYNSSKNWTTESLSELIAVIKRAIAQRDPKTLDKYRARVNFFAMSWDQEDTDANSQVIFDLGTFLRQSRVYYENELDSDSNAYEAYLRTWGWSYRIPTWYLYFRKIHFPADPEINGRWEWAGIYFGEKL